MSAPMLDGDRLNVSCARLRSAATGHLYEAATRLEDHMTQVIDELLRKAYIDALRDGFAQGVEQAARQIKEPR